RRSPLPSAPLDRVPPASSPTRRPMPLRSALAALLLAAAATPAVAQEAPPELRRVVLVNGDVYVGTVVDEAADPPVARTTDGVVRRFGPDQGARVTPRHRGRLFRTDPVRTRLFFAPTARTRGAGAFRGDLASVIPSVTAGPGDRVDLLASGFVTFGER